MVIGNGFFCLSRGGASWLTIGGCSFIFEFSIDQDCVVRPTPHATFNVLHSCAWRSTSCTLDKGGELIYEFFAAYFVGSGSQGLVIFLLWMLSTVTPDGWRPMILMRRLQKKHHLHLKNKKSLCYKLITIFLMLTMLWFRRDSHHLRRWYGKSTMLLATTALWEKKGRSREDVRARVVRCPFL
jgi:hypothetical protein